ncbi:hypothetical protein AAHE18_12G026600 [Arachis hypogaea]|nr:uncharacterized protein DS421_12g355860 [Arachis hypogaea]
MMFNVLQKLKKMKNKKRKKEVTVQKPTAINLWSPPPSVRRFYPPSSSPSFLLPLPSNCHPLSSSVESQQQLQAPPLPSQNMSQHRYVGGFEVEDNELEDASIDPTTLHLPFSISGRG